MKGTQLGTCQILFVRGRYDVEVDLVLAGPATVEGVPLVPGSPVSLSLVPPQESWARRRVLQRLRSWADDALPCELSIDLVEGVAVLTARSATGVVRGALADLDVLFASDLPESPA